jgi:hypothetical protein
MANILNGFRSTSSQVVLTDSQQMALALSVTAYQYNA